MASHDYNLSWLVRNFYQDSMIWLCNAFDLVDDACYATLCQAAVVVANGFVDTSEIREQPELPVAVTLMSYLLNVPITGTS